MPNKLDYLTIFIHCNFNYDLTELVSTRLGIVKPISLIKSTSLSTQKPSLSPKFKLSYDKYFDYVMEAIEDGEGYGDDEDEGHCEDEYNDATELELLTQAITDAITTEDKICLLEDNYLDLSNMREELLEDALTDASFTQLLKLRSIAFTKFPSKKIIRNTFDKLIEIGTLDDWLSAILYDKNLTDEWYLKQIAIKTIADFLDKEYA